MQLWPAPPAHDAVLRQTSAIAGYWHGVALDTPPPPRRPPRPNWRTSPPRKRPKCWRSNNSSRTPANCTCGAVSGPPTSCGRSGGPPRNSLDVTVPSSTASPRCRRIASARSRDGPLVARARSPASTGWTGWRPGWRHWDRGAPLPAPLTDWNAVWDRLFPGATVVATVLADDVRDADRPIAAESIVITTVQAAADDNPARAVTGAVDALTHGAAPPSVILGEVRARFDLG